MRDASNIHGEQLMAGLTLTVSQCGAWWVCEAVMRSGRAPEAIERTWHSKDGLQVLDLLSFSQHPIRRWFVSTQGVRAFLIRQLDDDRGSSSRGGYGASTTQ